MAVVEHGKDVAVADEACEGGVEVRRPGLLTAQDAFVAAPDNHDHHRVRARVVFGAADSVFSADTPARTATRIGAPAPTLIPDARHLTMISDPDRVAAAIGSLTA